MKSEIDFIQRVEKRIGLSLRYFFQNGFWVVLGQGVSMLSGLLLSVLFARYASKELYGQYQYVLSVIGIFSIFSLNGLNLSVMKAVIGGHEASLIRAVRYSFFMSLFASPLLLGIALYHYMHGSTEIGAAMLVAACVFPLIYSTNTWTAFYEAKRQFSKVAFRVMALQLSVPMAILAILFSVQRLPFLVAAYGITTAAVHFIFYVQARKTVSGRSDAMDVSLGIKATVQKFSQTINAALPLLVIPWLYSFKEAAVFSIAFFLANFMGSITSTVTSIYIPRFLEAGFLSHVYVKKLFFYALLLGLCITVIFWIGIRLFFIALYGEEYSDSLRILFLIMPIFIFYPLRALTGHYLTALNQNIQLIGIHIISQAAGLAALFILHSRYSYSAVLASYYLAMMGTLIALYVIRFLHLNRHSNQSIPIQDSSAAPLRLPRE